MAAAEEHEEGVVRLVRRGVVVDPAARVGVVDDLLATLTRGLAAAGVDQPAGRDRRQPRPRIVGRVVGPDPQRFDQRLLDRVLGGVEVLAASDQGREHPRDERAQGTLVQPAGRPIGHVGSAADGGITSRTSSHSYRGPPPGPGSDETHAAISSARS